MNRITRSTAALAAASLIAGAVTVGTAGVASATPTPPWANEAGAVGTIAFYNAAGQQITGGNLTDAPLAAYAEGSTVIRSGDTKATLFGYLPNAAKVPGQWSGQQLSASTAFPNASAPGALATASLPVVSGSSLDATISNLATLYPNTDTSQDGYAGLYELRIKTSAPNLSATASYDAAYIQVSGSTWSVVHPALSPISTTTSLTSTTASPQPYGTSIPVTATVSPAIPGSVQFENGSTPIGSPVAVDNTGVASTTLTSLPVGDTTLNAVFTPNSFLPYSTSTGSLSYSITPLTFTSTPVPTISGTAKVGATLTATPGTWDAGTSLAYQWLDGGAAISGATSATYVPTPAQLGDSITVSVTGSKAGYGSVLSTSTGKTVVAGTLSVTPTPTITGTPTIGSTLSASSGTWDAGVTLSYQWAAGGVAIPGATTSSLTLATSQLNASITVAVTGAKAGYTSVTKVSAGVTALKALTLTPTPTVTGNAVTGASLKAVAGTWTKHVVLGYQWKRNGAAIPGATTTKYVLTPSDFGTTITVAVTGSLAGYLTVTTTSAGSTVGAGTIAKAATPTISGKVKVGSTVTAVPGAWSAGVTLHYQWLLAGSPITGATSTTFAITSADLAQGLSVQVTGTSTGYTTVVKTSASKTVAAAKPKKA